MKSTYAGWWESPQRDELLRKIDREMDPALRKQYFAEIQKLVYEEVPVVKAGDVFYVRAGRSNIKNQPWQLEYFYWNVWREG
ncbi:MAG: hypothetical protein Q8P50_02155, partial [Bacillota bacterium]|nr:hypothetical protein [Bacillota bacterium]